MWPLKSPPVPLPAEPPSHFTADERTAYSHCKTYESAHSSDNEPLDNTSLPPIMAARILGWMLVHAPCPEGRSALASDINNSHPENALHDIATAFKLAILRCFIAAKDRTPTPSQQPSAPLSAFPDDLLEINLEQPPKTHSAAKVQALERDGYRCLLKPSTLHQPAIAHGFFTDMNGCRMDQLQCAHIFPPFTLYRQLDNNSNKRATALEIFERYGNIRIDDIRSTEGVHHLWNIMSLSPSAYADFSKMDICLMPTDEDDWYAIKIFPEYLQHNPEYPKTVRLGERRITVEIYGKDYQYTLPKPSPRLLALHASCAHVMHMSGVGGHVERVVRDMEDTLVMSSDGGSAGVLVDALLCADS
ncbi:hypothetical protein BDY19DRAFT_746002 [Irpex rosettiformis]|uniref:Uncharacterized protein n=1 Tax=Irpex rosettiformis TaxID=378272 RepID=A0ACB8TMK2_9APHY|nr:hypothetical protein BDY19DRAFT_746002 [Irpex rosettiformis]